jgi:hypothetical protein
LEADLTLGVIALLILGADLDGLSIIDFDLINLLKYN